jgi:uncharacterized membrane protein
MPNRKLSSSITSENIEAVIRLEEEEEHRIGPWDRIPHMLGSFVGTIFFVLLQCSMMAAWIVANSFGILSFDQFPYPLLSLVLGGEAVIVSSFVLIRQNRADVVSGRRNHLDLQINLLAEREITHVLRMLYALNKHMNVPGHEEREDKELTQETAVDELAKQLKEKECGEPSSEHA